jgi:hypothetical protein
MPDQQLRCSKGIARNSERITLLSRVLPAFSLLFLLAAMVFVPLRSLAEPMTVLHYASNRNFAPGGAYLPAMAGFNVADVSSVAQLDSLPPGVFGLVWVGQCNGVDQVFINTITPYIGHPKLFGFYMMDDPDPTGRYFSLCIAEKLKEEADWIHLKLPGAKTFVMLMNMSSPGTPSFKNTYNPANSHIDLFGLDPYPCHTEWGDCDYGIVDRYVRAAESWGVPRTLMVPVYQTFGAGNWRDGTGGRYMLPTAEQEQRLLDRWGILLPTPAFDYAYSWGSQNADTALESSPELQAVFMRHNGVTSR